MKPKIKNQATVYYPPNNQAPSGRRSNPLERYPRTHVRFLTSKLEVDDVTSPCPSI